jgi:hypothetical protein
MSGTRRRLTYAPGGGTERNMNGLNEDAAAFRRTHPAFAGSARFRSFGELGPVYEVLWTTASTARVRLVESGEELDYRLDRALDDPRPA